MEPSGQPVILGIAGGRGSGKSSLGIAVASRLNWPYASFGRYVRSVAQSRGLGENLADLQKLGEEMLVSDARTFCISVLSQVNWNRGDSLVLDGIRHQEVLALIRDLTNPAMLVIVFVATPSKVRIARLAERGEGGVDHFVRSEKHSTEAQVSRLKSVADLVVDGTRDISELSEEVVEFLIRRTNPK